MLVCFDKSYLAMFVMENNLQKAVLDGGIRTERGDV